MKKILLGTTALLIAGAFAASSAQAAKEADKSGVKLGLGGYFTAHGVYVGQDDGAGEPGVNTRNFEILRKGEVHFTGENTFDNGLTVGAHIELKAEPYDDQIAQSFIYFSGNWGKVQVGSVYSPAYNFTVGAPAIDPENWDGAHPDFTPVNVGTNAATPYYVPFQVAPAQGVAGGADNGNLLAEKVAYYTPRWNGFQGGISYAPDAGRQGIGFAGDVALGSPNAGMQPDNTAAQQSERWEAGVNYKGYFQNIGILAGVTYGAGDNEAVVVGATEDREDWNAGVQLSYMGFTFGGGYYATDNGVVNNGDTDTWTAGLTYTTGPWLVGLNYLATETETAATTEDSLDRWVLGGTYQIAPGVKAVSTLQFHQYDEDTAPVIGGNNDATVFTVGTTFDF
jgi:hypothetical protein